MPNKEGIVLGGNSSRGFNDNTMRGYPVRLTLTTRQVTDVVVFDEEILVRKICALRYLDGARYSDTQMIDLKENYPACTMPLSATSPTHVTPEILRSMQYAEEYVAHVTLIRELLDQASLSTNPDLLKRSNNQLLRSLGGLLRGASDCELTREPIPVCRTNPDADLVRQTTTLMGSDESISINMPNAPMPAPEGDATALMRPALVTHLTGSKPYCVKGGLIPHLTKKGYFWKSLHVATGLHYSLGHVGALQNAKYWVNQDGTTAKAASLAVPPMSWNNSVQRLTQHFAHMSMRNLGECIELLINTRRNAPATLHSGVKEENPSDPLQLRCICDYRIFDGRCCRSDAVIRQQCCGCSSSGS